MGEDWNGDDDEWRRSTELSPYRTWLQSNPGGTRAQWRQSTSSTPPRQTIQDIINQILGSTGGTAGELPSRTSGSSFLEWLRKLFNLPAGTVPGTTPTTPSGPVTGYSNILAEMMKNSGKLTAPVSGMGAIVNAPLESHGFDPSTYGQTSGEANFYGLTPQAKPTPLAAAPGLGAPSPPDLKLPGEDDKKRRDDDDDD